MRCIFDSAVGKVARALSMAVCLLVSGNVGASMLFYHQGNADPELSGLTLVDQNAGITAHVLSPVTNDDGFDSWKMNTLGDAGDPDHLGDLTYKYFMTAGNVFEADEKGWRLSLTMKVSANVNNIFTFGYRNASQAFQLEASTSGTDMTIDGLVLNGVVGRYHSWVFEDDDANGLAELYLDGVLVLDNIAGTAISLGLNQVVFGDGLYAAEDGVHVNIHQFGFETDFITSASLPATLFLLMAGVMTPSLRQIKKRQVTAGKG